MFESIDRAVESRRQKRSLAVLVELGVLNNDSNELSNFPHRMCSGGDDH